MIDKPGFYQITATTYHSDPCPEPSLSSSIAWEIEPSNRKAGSPAHAKLTHPRLGGVPKESSDEMRFGSICHSILLGTGGVFKIAPTFKTKQGKLSEGFKTDEGQQWKSDCESEGILPILPSEHKSAMECVSKWREQIDAFGLSYLIDQSDKRPCEFEQVVIWKEVKLANNDGGDHQEVWCRAMLDIFYLRKGEIWDLKTTGSVHPKKIIGKIVDDGLHLRSEFYKRGVEAVLPELKGKVKFGFLFCSTKAPFLVTPVEQLDGRFRHVGRAQSLQSIQTFGECLRNDSWPGYVSRPIPNLECPSWVFKEEITEENSDE